MILSPEECLLFAKELKAVLHSDSFAKSEYEERRFLTPLVRALEASGRSKRGMYLRATD